MPDKQSENHNYMDTKVQKDESLVDVGKTAVMTMR